MIENIVTCDRCKKKCEGTTYYTIDIYGNDINPTNDGRHSMATASQNVETNTFKIFGSERHYCEKCRDKIEQFLKMEDVTTIHIEQIPYPPKKPPLRVLSETFGFKKKRSETEKVLSKIAFHKWFKENG